MPAWAGNTPKDHSFYRTQAAQEAPPSLDLWNMRGCVSLWTPPPQTNYNRQSKTKVQRHDQDIYSNFRFSQTKPVFVLFENVKNTVFTICKPRDHTKSIGHRILLLVRGVKPQTDLLQSPNMKFCFFLEFMKISCCLWPAPHIMKHFRFLISARQFIYDCCVWSGSCVWRDFVFSF